MVIFYKHSLRTDFFFQCFFNVLVQCFQCNVLHRLFSRLRIEAPPLSTVQGKCIYTFLKRRISRFNFRSYVLNLVNINIRFFLSKIGSPGGDLSATHAQRALSVRLIYRPSMPKQSNRAGLFIGKMCLSDKIFGSINWPTAAKELIFYNSVQKFLQQEQQAWHEDEQAQIILVHTLSTLFQINSCAVQKLNVIGFTQLQPLHFDANLQMKKSEFLLH